MRCNGADAILRSLEAEGVDMLKLCARLLLEIPTPLRSG